jgi:hypothetical protein
MGPKVTYFIFSRYGNIYVTYAPDPRLRVTSANPTQMLRAPAERGARNKRCYFWTPLYISQPKYFLCHVSFFADVYTVASETADT